MELLNKNIFQFSKCIDLLSLLVIICYKVPFLINSSIFREFINKIRIYYFGDISDKVQKCLYQIDTHHKIVYRSPNTLNISTRKKYIFEHFYSMTRNEYFFKEYKDIDKFLPTYDKKIEYFYTI